MADPTRDPSKLVLHERLLDLIEYNPDTGVWVWKETRDRRRKRLVGKRAGGLDHDGYWRISLDGRYYRSGRLAWFFVTKQWPAEEIDHINNIREDDRFVNLRQATRRQQTMNRRAHKDNGSGKKGVRRVRGKFRARIMIDGKLRHIGMYASAEEAHAAYCEAAREAFGEFFRGPAGSNRRC
jgi:hypothetical protein